MGTLSIFKWCFTGCLCAAVFGCGGASGPKTVPVSGTVTAGGEPFRQGLVRFIPKPGQNINSREATTDEEGNYTIMFNANQPGLEPGDYTAMFTMMRMPEGGPLPDQTEEEYPKSPAQLGGVEWVAKEFVLGKAPECAVKVSDPGGTFDFELPELKAAGTK